MCKRFQLVSETCKMCAMQDNRAILNGLTSLELNMCQVYLRDDCLTRLTNLKVRVQDPLHRAMGLQTLKGEMS